MTDADREIVQRFLAGETPYSITRWLLPALQDTFEAQRLALDHVHDVLRAHILALHAEVQRRKGGRPRKWASDRERNAAAVRTYRAKRKAEKVGHTP